MLNHSTTRTFAYDDKQQLNDGSESWLGNIFSRSASHRTPLHDGDWPLSEKESWRESSPWFTASLLELKNNLGRYWSSSKQFSIPSLIRAPRLSLGKPLTSLPAVANTWFILQCAFWYTTSALSSNTGKAIMTQFRYPVTLTFIQFGFVALYCLLFMSPLVRFSKLRTPTRAIVRSTLPMGMFQVGGHMASSMAISRIPVSTVHTIKALSPLFTVAAYALLFNVSYSAKTYISLFPLTLGVMLACSFDMSASNAIGLFCAFASALVFVSSNIFFKKIMPSNVNGFSQGSAHKLDKLNLLFYSSSMAFILMIPIWLYSDLPRFLSAQSKPDHVSHPNHGHATPHSVMYYFFMNGTVHFAQNIIAFVILSSTSPVTYSIASLIKRVAVICIAIVWFSQPVHPIQGVGIALTFVGLYMYNAAKGDVARGENKMRRVEAARDLRLPSTKADSRLMSGTESPPPEFAAPVPVAGTTAMVQPAVTYGRPRGFSVARTPHYQQVAPPNLTIKITPPALNLRVSPIKATISPTESYPSPPPSVDSPPTSPVGLLGSQDYTRVST
jgi:solute carrier family 35 protein E1